jgi:hypothetical protein
MPKRKVKEEKPPKRLGKKEVLIPPLAMGVSLLVSLVIIPHFAPPPTPTKICLKSSTDAFNLYPRVQIFVDGKQNLLPDGIGNKTVNGKECLHVIHTDRAGSMIHVEYIRPIRLTMADFMKIYSPDNKTISVVDNSSGTPHTKTLNLENYNVHYSYYSEKGEFTKVNKLSGFPPFDNNMVARLELTSSTSPK